jgi:hypothetical protein
VTGVGPPGAEARDQIDDVDGPARVDVGRALAVVGDAVGVGVRARLGLYTGPLEDCNGNGQLDLLDILDG